MLSLLTSHNPSHYTCRSYVIGTGDDFSAGKAHGFERGLALKEEKKKKKEEEGAKQEIVSFANKEGKEVIERSGRDYNIHIVPRARQIHQHF